MVDDGCSQFLADFSNYDFSDESINDSPAGQESIKILKTMLKKFNWTNDEQFNWNNERKRRLFFSKFSVLIRAWRGRLPDLQEMFGQKGMDWLLKKAMKMDFTDFVRFVVSTGYKDKPELDEDGKPLSRRSTPLHLYASGPWFDFSGTIVHELFKIYDRFEVNCTDESGQSHFHVACMAGCEHVVKRFLEFGQDPNVLARETGNSPLHLALAYGRRQVAKLLLRNGADPNRANAKGLRPLHVVAYHIVDNDMADMLFDHVCDRQRRVQVDARDKLGNTALHVALHHGKVAVTESLLRRGASPNLANDAGSTALHFVCQRSEDDDDGGGGGGGGWLERFLDIVDGLGETLRVDARNKLGRTPLHYAVAKGHRVRVIRELLRRGADPNAADDEGSTPLHIICQKQWNDNMVEMFFEINKEIDKLVDVDARDKQGRTPLQWAVASLLPNTVDFLLNNGADLSNFVFPTGDYFCKRFDRNNRNWDQLSLASGALAVVEHLESRQYDLNRSDVLTIVQLFVDHGLFEKSSDLEAWTDWHDGKEFERQAKGIAIVPGLSLYELIQLRPEEEERRLSYSDYFRVKRSKNLNKIPVTYRGACLRHLCEKMSRGYFRRLALDPLRELTRHRLPILCYEKIIDELNNEDLLRICLANKVVAKESKVK
ncbi:serine/threonine-protein phosphatase 6 regulatory ankyrin repeat subunit A-like [Trichogramma pretiosum]|uniref:serine/threonine-protein phosphatase 6 regulatory ankyrin repeat subunit A-like n=1 Tax=Trichogramma pretiosum TaxID=7493 RepID=UPI0006C94833|nr:serine/threonine-protein phosphatase 6 regulatory ankyrin repeat subunit A-like [Trichogramma pretiosum]